MKISDGFKLRNIAGENIIVPLGAKNVDLKSLVSLNNSGAYLWSLLQSEKTEDELLRALLEEYDVDTATAKKDLDLFVGKLRKAGIIE
jgi:hypothetical protein